MAIDFSSLGDIESSGDRDREREPNVTLFRHDKPFFYGWFVVASAAVGLFLSGFPIAVASFGVFFQSFAQEFKTGRASISLAFTILNVNSGLLSVVIGRLCDRFGARSVILPGLSILGLVLMSALLIGSSLWQLYLFYGLLGAVTPATTPVPYSLVISRWFKRRRGFALGSMMVGLGMGAIVMPPLAQGLITTFGWRSVFAILGGAVLLVPIPIVAALLRESPEEIGLLPDGLVQITAARSAAGQFEGLPWSEIWRCGTFWMITVSAILLGASVGSTVHIPAIFASWGASARTAALASSMAGLGLLLGRIGCGYLLDRHFGPYVAAIVIGLTGLGIAFLWIGGQGVLAVAGAFLVGLGPGSEVDILAYLMSRYFGLRSLSTAFGFGFGAFVLAAGLGPFLMGMGFDHTGSYRLPLAGFFVAAIMAAVLISRLGPYRYGGPGGTENKMKALKGEA